MDAYQIIEEVISKIAQRYGPIAARKLHNSRKNRRLNPKSRKKLKGVTRKRSKVRRGSKQYAHATDDIYRISKSKKSEDD